MIDLFTEIALDSIIIFFAFGTVAGVLYYAVMVALYHLSLLLSKETMRVLVTGRFRDLATLLKPKSEANFEIKLCDSIRAFFVLIFGFALIFLNFVFLDGILRIYTILFLFLGIVFSKIIAKSKMFSIIFGLTLYFLETLLFTVFLPIRLTYCILTKKE